MNTDYSYTGLVFPDRRPLLRNVEQMPRFDAGETGLVLSNAWWLASLCQLAYCREDVIAALLPRVGLQLVATFNGASTQGFLARGDGFAFLVFRGTEFMVWLDLWTDAQFELTPMALQPEVHSGFRAALNEVWPAVTQALDALAAEGLPVWYTGYSLGAALATLAAARRAPMSLVTFGSPRPGNLDFMHQLDELPVYRFVNCCDVVTGTPPTALGYWHVGEQVFLTAQGHVLRDPEPWHVARRQVLGQLLYQARLPWLHPGMVKSRGLADHAILNYIAALEYAVLAAR